MHACMQADRGRNTSNDRSKVKRHTIEKDDNSSVIPQSTMHAGFYARYSRYTYICKRHSEHSSQMNSYIYIYI